MKPWEKYAAPQAGPWEKYTAEPVSGEQKQPTLGDSGATWGALDNLGSGVWQGLGDELKAVGAAIKERMAGGLPFEEAYEQALTAYQGAREQFKEENPRTAIATDLVGQAAPWMAAGPFMTATTLPAKVGLGMASGATSGALNTEGDLKDRAKGAAVGATIGAAVPVGFEAAARTIKPTVSAAANRLRDAGITPTMGQMAGGTARKVEEKVRSMPLLGDMITRAERKGIEDFNEAAINKSLEPLNLTLPKGLKGHRAIEWAHNKISDAYQGLVSGLNAQMDAQFIREFSKLNDLTGSMVESRAKQFQKIIQDKLIREIPDSGVITGETLKKAESELGRLASAAHRAADLDQNQLGDALVEAQRLLRDLVARANPAKAAELKAVNNAFARSVRTEGAAALTGAREGVFTPAQLMGSVKAADKSKRHNAFAQGQALMQDFAEDGRQVLSNTVPDSGTAGRMLLNLGALGGGMYIDPLLLAATGGASALYTKPAQRLAAKLIADRPPGAQALSNNVRQWGEQIGPLTSALLSGQAVK